MYKTQIKTIPVETGESIEEMLRRVTENNEPIDARSPMIYTEKADGVLPQYDIRTDRFDLALDAIDKYNASITAKAKETPSTETTKVESTELEV